MHVKKMMKFLQWVGLYATTTANMMLSIQQISHTESNNRQTSAWVFFSLNLKQYKYVDIIKGGKDQPILIVKHEGVPWRYSAVQ